MLDLQYFLFILDFSIIVHTFLEDLYIFHGPTLVKKHGCLLTLKSFCREI